MPILLDKYLKKNKYSKKNSQVAGYLTPYEKIVHCPQYTLKKIHNKAYKGIIPTTL